MRLLRRMLQVVLLLATLLVGAAALAIIVSQTAWFREWLRALVVRQANQYLNGQLSIGKLGGNLFFGLEFEDLGVTQGGERVITVKNAGVDYSVIQFISGNIVVDHIRLDRPVVVMKKEAGAWNLAQLVKRERQEKKRTGPGRSVAIGEVGISDGTFLLDPGPAGASPEAGARGTSGNGGGGGVALPREIRRLDARFSFKYEPVHYTVDIAHVSLRARQPDLALNALSGRISERDASLFLDDLAIRTAESSLKVAGEIREYASEPALKLEARADKFSIPEMARVLPALRGIPLQPAFEVKASGPLSGLGLDFAVRSSAGDASGQVKANVKGPERAVKGEVHLSHLDLAPIVRNTALRSDLSGLARLDVAFPTAPGKGPVAGTFSVSTFSARLAGYRADKIEASGRVDGTRVTVHRATAVAYGAAATAAGTVDPAARGTGGRRGIGLDLQGSVAGLDLRRLPRQLKVPALDSRLNLDYHVQGVGAEMSGDAWLRESMVEGAAVAEGTKASFSSAGKTIEYGAEGALGNLDIQRLGQALKIEALAADRFKSRINGRFSVHGTGTAVPTLTLDARADLNSSTLDAIELPLMNVEAHLANGAGKFRADGGFSNLDPSRFTGKPETKGNVAGRVNAEFGLANLAGPIGPDDVQASGEVALDRSEVGGLDIDRARVAGQYANSGGRIDEATITGPDIAVRASGVLALGTSGSSDLAYHVESPDLAAIGKVAGRKDLQGFLALDGRVTGNRASLRTEGNLKGGRLKFGSADVLTAESRYDVTIPDLETARVAAKADSTLGFLKIGGQDVNVLRATTSYASNQVDFDVNAEQSVRSGRFVGKLMLEPEYQEVALSQLGFSTQGVTWSIAPGVTPRIRYGGGDVRLQDVHLVSGEQSIAVEGTVGKESNLRAALTSVNLANVDTWLIGDRRLGGMLNAAATVTGPASAPDVKADFSVDGGAFREFRYDTLGGNVRYRQDRIDLDVRLQQGPQSWLTARGGLPVALFKPPTTPEGKPAPGSDAPVSLEVKSSPIDLGLVQGFTTAITKATGTMLADVRLSGTAARPQMAGQVSVSNGAFTVTPVGVSYKNLDGRIEFQPGRALVQQLAVTDEHDRTMTLSGEMALQARSLGAVKLKVNSRKFEVIHNDLGRVTVNTDLNVAGEMRAPQVTGDIALNTGTLNIDRILDLASSSAYSTTPAAGATATGGVADAPGRPPVGTAGRGQTYPEGAPQAAAPTAAAPNAGVPPGGPPPPANPNAAAEARAVNRGVQAGPGGQAGPGRAGQGSQPGQPGAPAAPTSPLDGATINVSITVPDDLVLNGKDIQPGNTPIGLGNVNITLGGNLRVSKRPGQQVRFVGQVNTVRGTYDFQGRRFDIQRDGRIRFDGFVPINPSLDIVATRLISGVEARVRVGGTMRKPELTLSSNPPLEQADILSLIVFNQPANELGTGEQVSLASRASALATGFVAGRLADSIGKALNLDVFEIQTAATPGGGQGATVTVGEQVGRNLYFKVVQGVGADNTSQFVLDYTITDWLRFQTTMVQGGTATRSVMRRVEQSGADLIFFFSY